MTTEENFNPRFPRGKRLTDFQQGIKELIFQSTLPAGEATGKGIKIDYMDEISIHASRGGSDWRGSCSPAWSPEFQSTLPAGEATA